MTSFLLFLLALGLTEAIAKPVVTRLTQIGIKKYIFPAYQQLDRLLTVPANWKLFLDNAEAFVAETVIPAEVDNETAKKLASYLLKNFDLDTFLSKTKGLPR